LLVLYELSKAFKKNHKLVNKFIADSRDGKVVGNLREAAHLSIDNVDCSYILTDVALASLAKFFASKSES